MVDLDCDDRDGLLTGSCPCNEPPVIVKGGTHLAIQELVQELDGDFFPPCLREFMETLHESGDGNINICIEKLHMSFSLRFGNMPAEIV
jgi:hypothetical protein